MSLISAEESSPAQGFKIYYGRMGLESRILSWVVVVGRDIVKEG